MDRDIVISIQFAENALLSQNVVNIMVSIPMIGMTYNMDKKIAIIGLNDIGFQLIQLLKQLNIHDLIIIDERANSNSLIKHFDNNIGENETFFNFFQENKQLIFNELKQCDFIFYCSLSDKTFQLRQILRCVIELNIPVLDISCNAVGGFISINTRKDFSHFDNYTYELLKNKKNNYPAYYNYLIAGEAINAMFQYFNKIRFAPVDSRLDIDFYHHQCIQSDKYSFI